MSTTIDNKSYGDEQRVEEARPDNDSIYAEKQNVDRAGAIMADNAEHKMGVLAAVRAYPMASFWAFVMSSTIVSSLCSLSCLLLLPPTEKKRTRNE